MDCRNAPGSILPASTFAAHLLVCLTPHKNTKFEGCIRPYHITSVATLVTGQVIYFSLPEASTMDSASFLGK